MFAKTIGLIALLAAVCSAQKIPVHVYYEALCPDSQAFITGQLYPTLNGPLGKFVDLKLVPYGKSNYTTLGADVTFTCHHGPNECYGNKVQSCAIEHIQVDSFQNAYTRESKTLEYINCLMLKDNNFADALYPGKKCAMQGQLSNWNIIESCANNTEGSKLLQKNGELTNTLNPSLTSVPTVTFRNVFERDSQSLALSNFRIALCKQIPAQSSPQECSPSPNSAPAVSFTTSMLTISALFVMSKLF